MPTFAIQDFKNAYYASPGHDPRDIIPKEYQPHLDKDTLKQIREIGHIGYDPKFNKPGIMAHEAGHAAMRTNYKWHQPKRFNQSILRPLGMALMPFSVLAAGATGENTGNPLYGALAGLGSAGLLSAPTLINEHQATGYAKKYLDKANMPEHVRNKNKDSLNKAYHTYVAGSLGVPTLFGAGAGIHGWANKQDSLTPEQWQNMQPSRVPVDPTQDNSLQNSQ